MPEKNPDIYAVIWASLTHLFHNHNQTICSAIIAFLLSLSRTFLYGKEGGWKRKTVEAFMCGLLAYCARSLLVVFQLNEELITPIGAIIGLLGIDLVRKFVLLVVYKKAGVTHNDENQ